MSTEVKVIRIPDCDICTYDKNKPGIAAVVDGRTKLGPWANMCEADFETYGVGLGTGKGQRLVLES